MHFCKYLNVVILVSVFSAIEHEKRIIEFEETRRKGAYFMDDLEFYSRLVPLLCRRRPRVLQSVSTAVMSSTT